MGDLTVYSVLKDVDRILVDRTWLFLSSYILTSYRNVQAILAVRYSNTPTTCGTGITIIYLQRGIRHHQGLMIRRYSSKGCCHIADFGNLEDAVRKGECKMYQENKHDTTDTHSRPSCPKVKFMLHNITA